MLHTEIEQPLVPRSDRLPWELSADIVASRFGEPPRLEWRSKETLDGCR